MKSNRLFGLAERKQLGKPALVVAEMLQLEMAECPYCFHAWQSKVDWRLEKCPRCGQMVSRAMLDEKWD